LVDDRFPEKHNLIIPDYQANKQGFAKMDVSTFLDQYDQKDEEIAQLKKNAAELMEVREQMQKEIDRLKPFEDEALRLRPLAEENEKLNKAVTACHTYLKAIKDHINLVLESFQDKDEVSEDETN
jgi:uncharacterized protein YukE